MKTKKTKRIEKQLHDFLMDKENSISIKEARLEIGKKWPRKSHKGVRNQKI